MKAQVLKVVNITLSALQQRQGDGQCWKLSLGLGKEWERERREKGAVAHAPGGQNLLSPSVFEIYTPYLAHSTGPGTLNRNGLIHENGALCLCGISI